MRNLFLVILLLASVGCAAYHPVVPPGTIPAEQPVSPEDEQYGHEVLGELSREYPLDRNDANINRVRDVVDRITTKGLGSQNPWHIHVLTSTDFKNAAATRGNYIFVWTGLLATLKNDDELATVLSHEIGHVLAGHTASNPTEEAGQILSGVAGEIASTILSSRGLPGVVGDLAGELLSIGLNAMLVNPGQRSKELEADIIGMFLMAKAGIDPQHAVDFWKRVQTDPDFSNSALAFLSSHPSSEDRLQQLLQYVTEATRVYHGGSLSTVQPPRTPNAKSTKGSKTSRSGSANGDSAGFALESAQGNKATMPRKSEALPRKSIQDNPPRENVRLKPGELRWRVEETNTKIYSRASEDSEILGTLEKGATIAVTSDLRRWLEISNPHSGFVRSRDLSPVRELPTSR